MCWSRNRGREPGLLLLLLLLLMLLLLLLSVLLLRLPALPH